MLKKFLISPLTLLLFLMLLLTPTRVYSPRDGQYLITRDIYYRYSLVEYTEVALYMAKKYIAPMTNTLVIMERCEFLCEEHKNYHVTLLHHFLYNLNYSLSIQLFLGRPDERPWDYNLFVIDSWWAFEALHFHFPINPYERQFYFFILLNMVYEIHHQVEEHMMRIFAISLRYNIKNVVIMYRQRLQSYISFYSYDIFGPNHCYHHINVREVNRFEYGELQHAFLFPDHMRNFYGCTLTVCGHIVEPLLAFHGDIYNRSHLREMHRLRGTEGEILKVVAKTLNLTLQYKFPSELNIIGRFFNSSGCFRELERGTAQIAIGSLSPLFANSYRFSYSYAYHTTPYVFVVRGGMVFGPIKQLMNPLNRSTWVLVAACLTFIAMVIFIIEYYEATTLHNFLFGSCNTQPMRSTLVILLGNPIPWPKVPKRNFARFLLFCWLFFTFELRNGYQGKMFDSLRLGKRLPVPQKINELADHDYTLLTAMYHNFYPRNKTELMRNSTERMHEVNRRDKRYTTTELLDYLIAFNIHNWNTSSLTYIEENIYFYQCVAFFSKHSIIRPSFDRKLKLLSDAGITGHIAQRYQHRHGQIMKSRSQIALVKRITNANLSGLYTIFISMCQFSIGIFILEILSKKSKRLKRVMDWLN